MTDEFTAHGNRGEFAFPGGRIVAVSAFGITTLPGGEIRIESTVPGSYHPLDEVFGSEEGPSRFDGTSFDGARVCVAGQIVIDHARQRDYGGFDVTHVCIGGNATRVASPLAPDDVFVATFALVNVVFGGKELSIYQLASGETAFRRDRLAFELEGLHASLTRIFPYSDVLKRIRQTGGVAITAELRFSGLHEAHTYRLELIAGRFCDLLTLATGNLVTWQGWTLRNSAGVVVREKHHTAVTRRLNGGSGVIDTGEPRELRAFVESCYERFVELEDELHVHRVVHAYVDGLTGSFLETRALAMGVLGEYLVGRYLAMREERVQIWANESAATALREFLVGETKRFVTPLAKSLELDFTDDAVSALVQMFVNKLAAINQPNFAQRLVRAAELLDAGLTEEDIKRFVATRNDLAHRMAFDSRIKPAKQYFQMRYVVERLILALLGYAGPFVDCRTWTRQRH